MEPLSIKEIADAVGGSVLYGNEETLIHYVSTNSKEEATESLFVPIIGERVDGHDFIHDAFKNGAIACFISKDISTLEELIYIKVEDTLKALQMLGSYYRNKFNIPVIGITGSVGKTTTKEMVSCALETKYNVLKTIGNMNSQVGLSLMMFHMNKEHEIAVIEMGMSEPGEMERLTKISRPELAIITNIGVSHIAQLKTKENIRKEKCNIINAFNKESILYLNGDDILLKELYHENLKEPFHENIITNYKENSQSYGIIDLEDITREKLFLGKTVSYGLDNDCEYRAENIRTSNGKTYFTLCVESKAYSIEEKDIAKSHITEEEVVLSVLGIHNVYNALVALAVANHYGITSSVAKLGLETYSPISMRGQIKKTGDITFIDDSYNASPDSMKSGIGVLLSLENVKRRIAVLADVRELGEVSHDCHYEVGVYISSKEIDEVITIGEEAFYIGKGIEDNNKSINVVSFYNNEEVIRYLKKELKQGDGVLVKGSRSMRTDEIVKAFCES
jgi:UDP-N-acetylmuramoyl-tripeptide--D-alanyl-D-alanine ligase